MSRIIILALASAWLLYGCIDIRPDTRYYTLSPTEPTDLQEPQPKLTLGLGPIEIPDLIDRREIVVRRGAGRVDILPFDLWGGSTEEGIRNTLASDLSARLGTEQLLFYPFRGAPLDWQASIEILDLSGTPNGSAELIALWSVTRPKSRTPTTIRRGSYTTPVSGSAIDQLVSSYSRLLGLLADDIAAQIHRDMRR